MRDVTSMEAFDRLSYPRLADTAFTISHKPSGGGHFGYMSSIPGTSRITLKLGQFQDLHDQA